jgi:putative membrane protein
MDPWLGVGFGLLLLLLIAAAVALAVVAVTRGSPLRPPAHPGPPTAPPPEQVLAERLARGEIEVSDYEERVAALRRQAGGGETASAP